MDIREKKEKKLEKKFVFEKDANKSGIKKENLISNTGFVLICIIVIAIVIGMGIKFFNQSLSMVRLERQKIELQQKIAEEKKSIESLRKDLLNSKTPEFIEKQAREQLKMVKPNERVYIDLERKQ